MRKLLAFAFISFLSLNGSAQNLVINGGFEPPDCDLPAWYLQDIIPPWETMVDGGYWQDQLTLYYGPCTSRGSSLGIPARTGDGHIGFPVYGLPRSTDDPHQSRGYPVGVLTEPLEAGRLYQVTYWVHPIYNLAIGTLRGTNAPGVLFVRDTNNLPFDNLHVLVSDKALYPAQPILDYTQWTQVCISFVADGGEKYIILGNFRRNEDSNIQYLDPDNAPDNPDWDWGYYMVDDLILQPYTPEDPVLPATANLCPDEEVTIQARAGVDGTWDDGSTENTRTVDAPGQYTFTYLDGTCIKTDICNVVEVNCEKCNVYFPSAITPNGDGLNDEWSPMFECDPEEYRLEVFDRYGNLVFRTYSHLETWKPESNIQMGTYVARLRFTYNLYGKISVIDEVREITILE